MSKRQSDEQRDDEDKAAGDSFDKAQLGPESNKPRQAPPQTTDKAKATKDASKGSPQGL